MQLKTLIKHALLIAVVTASTLFAVFLVIIPSIFTGASGFIYTRTPTGNSVASPLSIRIQGIFGVDFCENPESTYYIVQYVNTDLGSQFGTGFNFHNQGDVVDEISQIDINPGIYQQSKLFCDTPDGTYTIVYGVDSGGSLTILPATPTPTPTTTPTPTPSATSAPASANSSSGSTTGTINVVKVVINDNGGTKVVSDFPLFINGQSAISGQTYTFPAPAPAFTVTETGDTNYTRSFSGDCDSNGQFNLNGGDNKFCVVTNNDIGVAFPNTGLIPPLINVVKVPNPLALPGGPGPVTYTYALSNIGTVPVTDIVLVGDTCSPIVLISGDTNSDTKLDVNETWIHRCTTTLTETHTNTITATGWANGISAVDIASARVVVGAPGLPDTGIVTPPLIHVTKIPSPLILSARGGLVSYKYKITNPGVSALSNVYLTDDNCAPIIYISGDVNGDQRLSTTETWTYTCQANLIKTTTNTVTARGEANGLIARDFAIVTVVVAPVVSSTPATEIATPTPSTAIVTASESPTLPDTGTIFYVQNIFWSLVILIVIIIILVLLYEERRKHQSQSP